MQPPEFFQGMFNVPDQSLMEKHNMLQPLTMPEQLMLLGPLELLSPSTSSSNSIPSGYSSPISPHVGPFTPVHTLDRQYSPDECEQGLPEPQSIQCDSPTDTGMRYPTYSWENTDMWANSSSEMMLGEDFDLNSIPPFEIGNAK